MESLFRGAPVCRRRTIQRVEKSGVAATRRHRRVVAAIVAQLGSAGTGDRDSRPVTMAGESRGGERGPGGASLARSAGGGRRGIGTTSPRRSGRDGTGRPAATGCSDCFTPPTSTSVHATPTSASGRNPARAAVRRIPGGRSTRHRGEGRRRPDRRRPVRLEHPAETLGRARRRRAQASRRARRSGPSSSRAPTTATTASSIYRSTTSRRWPGPRPDDDLVTVLTPDRPTVHLPPATSSSTGRSSPRSARRTARCRDLRVADGRGRGHVARRDGPRLARDPRSDRSRRGRRHQRGDRGDRPRLSRPRALALRPAGQGGHDDLRVFGRPGARRGQPGRGRQGPPRRASRRRAGADRHDRGAAVGRTRFEKLDLDAARIKTQPELVGTLLKRPTRISSSTSASPAFGRTSSTSTRRGRGAAEGLVPASPSPRRLDPGPVRGQPAVARHDRRRVHPQRRGPDRRARGGPGGASSGEAAELRDVLRLGRLLLAGHEVTL